MHGTSGLFHDDVIKWKHFPHYWSFVRGTQLSLVNSVYFHIDAVIEYQLSWLRRFIRFGHGTFCHLINGGHVLVIAARRHCCITAVIHGRGVGVGLWATWRRGRLWRRRIRLRMLQIPWMLRLLWIVIWILLRWKLLLICCPFIRGVTARHTILMRVNAPMVMRRKPRHLTFMLAASWTNMSGNVIDIVPFIQCISK